MLWLGFWYTSGASSSKQLGSQHWGKRIIAIVPLTWIQQQGAAFGIVPSDLSARLCVVDVILDWCIWSDVYMHVVHCWYVIMNCLGIRIITWLWYCLGGMALTVDNVDIIDYVMLLIYCHWLWLIDRDCPAESVSFDSVSSMYIVTGEFHMRGFRICSVRLCVVDVFC